jgi:hypothetical protein
MEPGLHEIHDFLRGAQRDLQEEYNRIQKRAVEDPGTAGDQGEENWKTLLSRWLPPYFQIVTKGRILTASGYASDQVDVLVLSPSYPNILLDKKLYLAGGVVAAFECKTTLKAEHVISAAKTCAELKRNLPKRKGSPFLELHSPILFGLLAHSHSWKRENSAPLTNIETALWVADKEYVKHPVECIDFVCVADLATWLTHKITFTGPRHRSWSPQMETTYGKDGSASSSYVCAAIGAEQQKEHFTPIGPFLSRLYQQLAWSFQDMRGFEQYLRLAHVTGSGRGGMRSWNIDIYSPEIRGRISTGPLSNGVPFDEWHCGF